MKTTNQLAQSLYQYCLEYHLVLATAESCTGGLVSSQITEIAGSSQIFDRAFVTYSNAAKKDMLNVSDFSLNKHGAVSEKVAIEMLKGALKHSNASLAVSITGIAGPSGGTTEKPVGTVCFAWGSKEEHLAETQLFSGNRTDIRNAAVKYAFECLLCFIQLHHLTEN